MLNFSEYWIFYLSIVLMLIDELAFHANRTLPKWERVGHPLDAMTVWVCSMFALLAPFNLKNVYVYCGLAVISCLFVTKDEPVHDLYCRKSENLLHAILFFIHPIVLWQIYGLWSFQSIHSLIWINLGLSVGIGLQWYLWNRPARVAKTVNNDIYHHYGDRWYTAYDDPVALLRAENKAKENWILKKLEGLPHGASLLDVGCGAGFMSNALARSGFQVTGVDISESALTTAKKYDSTKTVHYVQASAFSLPFENGSFDGVTCLDFLEHVSDPASIVRECARVLKPGGQFFFHTFNRNWLSKVIVLKGVEWVVKNTPKNLHLYEWFIKPSEMASYCKTSELQCLEWTGLRPKLSKSFFKLILSGEVPNDFEFATTSSLSLSYLGLAKKEEGFGVEGPSRKHGTGHA